MKIFTSALLVTSVASSASATSTSTSRGSGNESKNLRYRQVKTVKGASYTSGGGDKHRILGRNNNKHHNKNDSVEPITADVAIDDSGTDARGRQPRGAGGRHHNKTRSPKPPPQDVEIESEESSKNERKRGTHHKGPRPGKNNEVPVGIPPQEEGAAGDAPADPAPTDPSHEPQPVEDEKKAAKIKPQKGMKPMKGEGRKHKGGSDEAGADENEGAPPAEPAAGEFPVSTTLGTVPTTTTTAVGITPEPNETATEGPDENAGGSTQPGTTVAPDTTPEPETATTPSVNSEVYDDTTATEATSLEYNTEARSSGHSKIPTFSPTLEPTWLDEDEDTVETTPPPPESTTTTSTVIVEEVEVLPDCPPAYDPSGATHYEGGVVAEVTSHVFQCHSLYEVYCNVAEWDDSLLADNPNAEQEWNEAWVHLGACTIVDHVEPVTYEGDSSLSMPDNETTPPAPTVVTTPFPTGVVDAPPPRCTTQMCSVDLSDTTFLKYQVNSNDGSITVEIISDQPQWLAFGLSKTGEMIGSEAVIGLPDNGGLVEKYWLGGKSVDAIQLMPSEQQTLIDASITVDEYGQTIMKFTKLLSEEGEIEILSSGGTSSNIFLFASGYGTSLSYHKEKMVFDLSL